MIWDFMGHLLIRDHVVSIKDGPSLLKKCQKFGEFICGGIRSMKKLEVKIIFRLISSHKESPFFLISDFTTLAGFNQK